MLENYAARAEALTSNIRIRTFTNKSLTPNDLPMNARNITNDTQAVYISTIFSTKSLMNSPSSSRSVMMGTRWWMTQWVATIWQWHHSRRWRCSGLSIDRERIESVRNATDVTQPGNAVFEYNNIFTTVVWKSVDWNTSIILKLVKIFCKINQSHPKTKCSCEIANRGRHTKTKLKCRTELENADCETAIKARKPQKNSLSPERSGWKFTSSWELILLFQLFDLFSGGKVIGYTTSHVFSCVCNSIQFNSFIISTVDIQRKALLWQGIQVTTIQWQICTVHLTKYRYMYRERYNGRYIYIYIYTYIYMFIYTCLLFLISMLWHRQAIFESKGDKLSSSAEGRIRTQGLRYLFTSRPNACWQTDWAIEDQAKKLERDSPSPWSASIQPTRPYCQLAFAPGSGDIHVCIHTQRHIYTHIRIYTHIHSHIYTYTYTYTYMHTHSSWTGQTLIMAVVRQETSKWLK